MFPSDPATEPFLTRPETSFELTFGTMTTAFSGVGGVYSAGLHEKGHGRITGESVGFDPLFQLAGGPFNPDPQDGSARDFSYPFLSATFVSEAVAVPEPSTLDLLGAGLLGLFMRRKRVA